MNVIKQSEIITLSQTVDFVESTTKSRHLQICKMLLQFLQFVKDLLFDFIDDAIHWNRDKLGMDICQLRLNNCEMLEEYDSLIQGHIDAFHKRTEGFWELKNTEESLSFFKKKLMEAPSIEVANSFHALEDVISKSKVPGATREDKHVIKKLCNIIADKTKHEKLHKNLSLRDMKVFHNVFIKCMNYAIQSKNKEMILLLCNLAEIFEKHSTTDVLNIVHQENLRNDKYFIEFLKIFALHLKYNIKIGNDSFEKIPMILFILIEHFVHNKPFHENETDNKEITYKDMSILTTFADNIHRNMEKCEHKTPVERDLYILETAGKLGIINPNVLKIVNRVKGYMSVFLEEDLNKILSEVKIDMSVIRDCVELFPVFIHRSIGPIGVHLSELFESHAQ